tara:strand:+ start:120 stop:629 length:510 start_codon:yes stop_codon:yes gene_type:complete
MPQGPGTYGSQRGRPPKKSGFKLKSGNTAPFKQMGSSPLKQDYHEALEHHKKYIKAKTSKVGNIANDPIHKEINRIAKGGKPKYDQMMLDAAKKRIAAKKAKRGVVKTVLKGAGKVASKFAGPVGVAITAYDVGKFVKDWVQTGDVEKAWDKNKWWGNEKGNLFKKDDK